MISGADVYFAALFLGLALLVSPWFLIPLGIIAWVCAMAES